MLKVVTDSTADLPPMTVRDLDIHVVPLSIHFGATTYIDGEDIDAATFYHLLQTATVHPHTAQPPPGRFEAAFRSLAAARHEIVTITVSSALSGTFNSATVAAATVPEARVMLIDSGTTSMALGSMVARVARMGVQGCQTAEIVTAVDDMRRRLSVVFLVDTLTYLQRGGRIGRASSLVGTMLHIKPLLTIHEGQVAPLKRARTRSAAIREMLAVATAQAPWEEVYVMHAAAEDEAGALAAALEAVVEGRRVPVLALGPVLGLHLGPGALAVVTLRRSHAPAQG